MTRTLRMRQWGGGRSLHRPEIIPGIALTCYPPLDPSVAKFIRGYLALPDAPRARVRVALLRLNQALRRRSAGDGAIELSIAFEALTGDDQTMEMTHKVKVRSSRILGGTSEERRRNSAIVGRMYALRSKLVHTGTFRQKPGLACL